MPDPFFRELRGDYVENVGQVVTPREYLDYLEPLGSALSRLPDGVGGPFVYQFRGSGGRVVGAMGWVVSAASKRYGGWNLWGVWTDGPIPALTLPLLWPELINRGELPSLLEHANEDADRLQRREAWPELLDRITATPLHDDELRTTLKIELSRLYRAPYPDERPLEIDLPPSMLDVLPWVYLLGPVDPSIAQLQPSRFNGAGYQYILTDAVPADGDISTDINRMVDTAASDVLQGFRMASALRERRARPRPKPAAAPRKPRPSETEDMASSITPQPPRRPRPATREPVSREGAAPRDPAPPPAADLPVAIRAARDLIIIALLAWIAWNVHQLRKSMSGTSPAPTVSSSEMQSNATSPSDVSDSAANDDVFPDAAVSATAPAPVSREQRLAAALTARPPQGIRLLASASDNLPRTAVEIFLRRNGCHARSEPVDGRFSAAEQKSIRTCAALTTQRLMRNATDPNDDRALDWLEQTLTAR